MLAESENDALDAWLDGHDATLETAVKRLTCSKHSGADVSLSGSFEPQTHRLKVVTLRVITETDTPLEQVREVFDARKSADPSEPDVVVVRLVVVDQNNLRQNVSCPPTMRSLVDPV